MPVEPRERPTGTGVFPSADHFPLGRPYGCMDAEPAAASAVRPFGLTLAVRPRKNIRFNPDELGYDVVGQIGLIRDGDVMVPMSRHTDGTTKTQTNADGQSGPDSDTDVRED
jgi:putative ATP-grasp target RiPP